MAQCKKQQFENFLELLKGHEHDSLIESIKEGFKACFEGKAEFKEQSGREVAQSTSRNWEKADKKKREKKTRQAGKKACLESSFKTIVGQEEITKQAYIEELPKDIRGMVARLTKTMRSIGNPYIVIPDNEVVFNFNETLNKEDFKMLASSGRDITLTGDALYFDITEDEKNAILQKVG